jgi:hypothetical protein
MTPVDPGATVVNVNLATPSSERGTCARQSLLLSLLELEARKEEYRPSGSVCQISSTVAFFAAVVANESGSQEHSSSLEDDNDDDDDEQLKTFNATSKLGAVPFFVVRLVNGQDAALYLVSWDISGRHTTDDKGASGL